MKITTYYEDGTIEWVIYYDIQDVMIYAKSESGWQDTTKCVVEDGPTFISGFAQ